MIPAIIVCHGKLSESLLHAVEGICGQVECMAGMSNDGQSGLELSGRIEKQLLEFGGRTIMFTDYFGGSCATACLSLMAGDESLRLISGVNLPTLIYYLGHRHELEIDELVSGIIHRGQNSIRELHPPGL